MARARTRCRLCAPGRVVRRSSRGTSLRGCGSGGRRAVLAGRGRASGKTGPCSASSPSGRALSVSRACRTPCKTRGVLAGAVAAATPSARSACLPSTHPPCRRRKRRPYHRDETKTRLDEGQKFEMRHARCRDGTLIWTNLVMSRAWATRETTRRVHDTMATPKGADFRASSIKRCRRTC